METVITHSLEHQLVRQVLGRNFQQLGIKPTSRLFNNYKLVWKDVGTILI